MKDPQFDRSYLDSVFGGKIPVKGKAAQPPPTRIWSCDCWAGSVRASSKSEARSLLKRALGGKLPPGTAVREVAG